MFKPSFLKDVVPDREPRTSITTIYKSTKFQSVVAPTPPEFNMEIVEVGFNLRMRTAKERFARDKDAVYDIEVLEVSVDYS